MHREQLQAIRGQMLRGEISYDQAKVLAQPIIDDMNMRGEKIAKQFGKKFKKFTFNGVMR